MKIYSYFLFFLLFQVIFCLSVVPYYIPSLEKFMIIVSCVLQLPILFFAGKIVWYYVPLKGKKTWFIGLGLLAEIVVVFIFTAMFFGQGFLGGHFVKAYEISSPKSSFYIYDSSFLESSYRIYVNHSFLPTMKFLYDKRGDASSIIIQEKGDIIIFNDNYYQNPVYYNIRQQKITSSQQ